MKSKINNLKTIIKNNPRITLVLVLGCLLRLVYIGNIPGNRALFVDEMFSGYESYSILKYGMDFAGYHFPIYLPAWGSGMSAMQAYIQMPFILIFGLNSFALRLPAAILGCITLYAFYYICDAVRGKDFATFATFILAIMPWHIMQSRWALDANYFTGFITITIALLIKASRNNKYLPLAFFFIGATLYTYVLPWTVMPIFVLGCTIYLLCKKLIRFDRYLIISFIILGLMAIPLLLFVLINMRVIPEISTAFISIPLMRHFRSDELITSPQDVLKNLYHSLELFIAQNDSSTAAATPMFGLYYKYSNIVILLGIALTFIKLWENRKKDDAARFMTTVLFLCSVIIAGATVISFYRINMIHIPMTFFLVEGLWFICKTAKSYSKQIVILIYGMSCLFFLTYYITYHDEKIAELYYDGSKDALSYIDDCRAAEHTESDNNVIAISGISYVNVLFYEKYPADRLVNEIEYYDNEYTQVRDLAKSFGPYSFCIDDSYKSLTLDYNNFYICSSRDYEALDYLEENGFELHYFSYAVVAHGENR